MRKGRVLTLVSSLVLVLGLALLANPFASVSNAQTQGKVVVRSANIRQNADANSTVLGSAAQGASVTINGQATDEEGKVWYQVFVNADTLGYIRSDLVEITEGTTNETQQPTAPAEPTAEVTEVQPMSATVTGSESVRVRSDASTGSQIVAKAKRDLAITVTGHATGTDNRLWYRVNFIADGSEVVGFIRSDYVTLSGELVPKTEEPETPVEEPAQTEPEVPEEPEVKKDWDTEYDGEKWVLINNTNGDRWDINNIFETVKNNQVVVKETQQKAETQTIIIIFLVILAVAMAGFVAVLVFKVKDIRDSAYFEQVERETIRRRTADRPADKRVMHTVGAEKKPMQGERRPAGARPAGAPAQGERRPAGTRPAGAPAQGERRPAGTRPAGAPTQGERRPAGTRPAGAPAQRGQRPMGTRPGEMQKGSSNQNPGWKSKNFMTEDDEFEFEFLNWDGDDE